MSAPACPACDAPIEPGARACPSCRAVFAAEPASPSNRPPRWLWIVLGLIVGCPTITVAIGFAVTLFAPAVLDRARAATEAQAREDLAVLANALDEYALRHAGRYPAKLEELVTPDARDSNEARVLDAPRRLKDPWKHAYQYSPPSGADGARPRVWSFGVDGAEGGGDDLEAPIAGTTR